MKAAKIVEHIKHFDKLNVKTHTEVKKYNKRVELNWKPRDLFTI